MNGERLRLDESAVTLELGEAFFPELEGVKERPCSVCESLAANGTWPEVLANFVGGG